MGFLKRNPFGHILFIKKWLIRIFAVLTHKRYRGFNELQIEGSDIINSLPDTNVLFISNHQTYFADVVAMFHVFNASLKGRHDNIKNLGYIWQPKMNISYVGAITVERTWRAKGKDVTEKREVNPNDTENIKIALADGWVITFPQGTTKSFKPVRKGTAHIIKQHRPIVVPIVIDGFRRSFDKKGLRMKKKGILQSFIIKEPLVFDYDNETIEEIVEKVEYAIEQHQSFLKVLSEEEIAEHERLDQLRQWGY
jgi:1-acyl-sn-glycerol-3-phosphate acyltransferase